MNNIFLHFSFLKVLFLWNQKNIVLITLLLSLCFFNALCFANELSDEEKRAYIESLATPSTEERVFYRWQTTEEAQRILSAGEMTQELYEHFIESVDGKNRFNPYIERLWPSRGLYVAERIGSSLSYGERGITVVLQAGYPFLDLNDERIKELLAEKNISVSEAHKLEPMVAIKDFHDWWCLRQREGISFKPIPDQDIIEHFNKISAFPISATETNIQRFFNQLSKQAQIKVIHNNQNYHDVWNLIVGLRASKSELSMIVSSSLPYIPGPIAGLKLLTSGWKQNLSESEENRTKIIDKILSFIQNKAELSELYRDILIEFFWMEDIVLVLKLFQDRVKVKLSHLESVEVPRLTFSYGEITSIDGERPRWNGNEREIINNKFDEELREQFPRRPAKRNYEISYVPHLTLEQLGGPVERRTAQPPEISDLAGGLTLEQLGGPVERPRTPQPHNESPEVEEKHSKPPLNRTQLAIAQILTDHAISISTSEYNKHVKDPERQEQHEKTIRKCLGAFMQSLSQR